MLNNSDPEIAAIDKALVFGRFLYQRGNWGGAKKFWRDASFRRRSLQKSLGYATLQTRILSGRWIQNIGHFIFRLAIQRMKVREKLLG